MQIISKQKYRPKKKKGTTDVPKKGLSSKKVDKSLRFLLFLTVVGMFYIWNTHYAVKQVRKMESLQKEVKDLKSKYLMQEASLRAGTRLTEITSAVDTLGIRPLSKPAFKLTQAPLVQQPEIPVQELQAAFPHE